MNTAVTTTGKALKPIDEVRGSLEKMKPEFINALPSHISADKFQRVAVTAINSNPGLLNADRKSLYAACMKAAQDGLLPDGREGALVTFRTKNGEMVQWMPMTAGILKKVRNSGELSSIHAAVVYENELAAGKFDYYVDSDGQHINHRPILFGERGKPVGVYAMAKTKDGALYIEPLSISEIDKIRAVSRAAQNGPWVSWWDEMAKKSAIRRLSKRLPQSTDLDQVLGSDNDLFMPDEAHAPAAGPMIDATTGEVTEAAPAPKKRASRVKAAVEAAGEEAVPPALAKQVAAQNQAAAQEAASDELPLDDQSDAQYEDVM